MCRAGLAVPRLAVEPGRALVGPAGVTVYEVGTVKPVRLDANLTRTYVSVDGGMSDNVRTALVRRGLHRRAGLPGVDRAAPC